MSIAILVVLVLGIGAGYILPENISGLIDSASSYMLLVLLFSVGIDMGLNREVFTRIKELGFKILLIPFGVVVGSLCGGLLTSFVVNLPVRDSLAVSAGLGWYSRSGILITEAKALKDAPAEGYYLCIEILASGIQSEPAEAVVSAWPAIQVVGGKLANAG